MNRLSRTVYCLALLAPLSVIAQSTAPSSTGASGAAPAPGYENQKTTESGQSTTYPKGSAPTSNPSGTVDKTKSEITKGDGRVPPYPAKPLDEPATNDKPAKPGSQSGASTK